MPGGPHVVGSKSAQAYDQQADPATETDKRTVHMQAEGWELEEHAWRRTRHVWGSRAPKSLHLGTRPDIHMCRLWPFTQLRIVTPQALVLEGHHHSDHEQQACHDRCNRDACDSTR
jgi:hypothetical protein